MPLTIPDPEVAELIQRVIREDREAKGELFVKYELVVYYTVLRILNRSWTPQSKADVAEDLRQEIFLKVFLKLKEGCYDENAKFVPWLKTVARNHTIDWLRRQPPVSLQTDLPLSLQPIYQEDSIQVIDRQRLIEKLASCLETLLPSDRKVLELVYKEDRTWDEALQLVGLAESMAKCYGRVIRHLRKCMTRRVCRKEGQA